MCVSMEHVFVTVHAVEQKLIAGNGARFCHCPCCGTKINSWMVDTATKQKITFEEMAAKIVLE